MTDSVTALEQCETLLGYHFENRELLRRCLTHASVARVRLESNERLEFLGDAVLGLVVCESLFQRYPEYPEGELTRIKSVLVSRSTCAELATEIGLDNVAMVGKGLRSRTGIPMSVKAGLIESVIAGLYLDGGIEVARDFIERVLGARMDEAGDESSQNYKSNLQQLAQKRFNETPVYRLLDEQGPDHSKCFEVAVVIGSHVYPPAWGASKKEAEQGAASNALDELQTDGTIRS